MFGPALYGMLGLSESVANCAVIRLKFLSCLAECTSTLHSIAGGRVLAVDHLYDFERSKH